jgi:basic membrane protein A
MARIDLGVERAIHDMVAGEIPSEVVELGLADGDYGHLTLRKDVAPEIRARIDQIAVMVRNKQITIPDDYTGPEFQPETGLCIATA